MLRPHAHRSLALFERIRVINLAKRRDRRRAVTREMAALGEHIDGDRLAFHTATRPEQLAGFPTIGARGCFLSHLSALQEANRDGVSSLLILEDDVAFSAGETAAMVASLNALAETPWGIFYGGSAIVQKSSPLTEALFDEPIMLAHFIAFTRPVIVRLVPYLEAMLERPAGSSDGGPMHVDGAYCWFRRSAPDVCTFAATPNVAHQRASATDIHVRRGIDGVPLLRQLLLPMRGIKNMLRAYD